MVGRPLYNTSWAREREKESLLLSLAHPTLALESCRLQPRHLSLSRDMILLAACIHIFLTGPAFLQLVGSIASVISASTALNNNGNNNRTASGLQRNPSAHGQIRDPSDSCFSHCHPFGSEISIIIYRIVGKAKQ